jgi:hypothetical protein
MLLSLACLCDTDDDDESSLFHYRLKKQFRIKRFRRISRRALLDPMESGFIKLYQSGCTQSMITYTGFDHALLQSEVKPKPSQGKESLPDFTRRTTAAATTISTKNGTTSTNCSNDFWMSCAEAVISSLRVNVENVTL